MKKRGIVRRLTALVLALTFLALAGCSWVAEAETAGAANRTVQKKVQTAAEKTDYTEGVVQGSALFQKNGVIFWGHDQQLCSALIGEDGLPYDFISDGSMGADIYSVAVYDGALYLATDIGIIRLLTDQAEKEQGYGVVLGNNRLSIEGFQIYEDYIYYTYGYSLYRVPTEPGEREELEEDITRMQVTSKGIYCLNREGELLLVSLDGMERKTLCKLDSQGDIGVFGDKAYITTGEAEDYIYVYDLEQEELEKLELEDKWVLSRLNTLIREVTDNLEAYELGVASAKIYDFIWDTYCDWYIELTKTRLNGEDAAAKLAAENVLCYVLLRILELLHPFMPFLTEEIWQALPHEGDFLIRAPWPNYQDALHFPQAESDMENVKDAITAVRARRAEMNVPPSKKAQLILVTKRPETYEVGKHFITRMAYASELTVLTAAPADLTGMVTVATHDATVYMPMAELVDIAKELERIAAERKKAEENLRRIEAKLANESFTSRAPENVVNAEREKAEKARSLIAKLEESAAAMKL